MKTEILKLAKVILAPIHEEFFAHPYSTRVLFLTPEEKAKSSYSKIEKSLYAPLEEEIKTIFITKTGKVKELKTLKSKETAFSKASGIFTYSESTVTLFETEEIAYKIFSEEVKSGEEYLVYIPSESKKDEKEYALKKAKEELARIQKQEEYLKEYIEKLEKE